MSVVALLPVILTVHTVWYLRYAEDTKRCLGISNLAGNIVTLLLAAAIFLTAR